MEDAFWGGRSPLPSSSTNVFDWGFLFAFNQFIFFAVPEPELMTATPTI